MGLFIRNQDPRSELQTRIAAELQERLREHPSLEADKTEPAFTENQHQTRPAGIIVASIVIIGIIAAVVIVSQN